MNKPRKRAARAAESAGARHRLELRGQLASADAEFLAGRFPEGVRDEDAFALLMVDLVLEWLRAWGARGVSVVVVVEKQGVPAEEAESAQTFVFGHGRAVARQPLVLAVEAESREALGFARGRLFLDEPLGGVVQVWRMVAQHHWD